MALRRAHHLVLAGDIGGTNARLRLYSHTGRVVVDETSVPSSSGRSLEAIIAAYLGRVLGRVQGYVSAAVLGIAGPVVDGISRTTNLPWVIDEKRLAEKLRIPRVRLVNDLAAIAMGCSQLPRRAYNVVSAGRDVPKNANIAVIAAGTGLGEALLVWDGAHHVPCASEGGHSDFAPRNDLEVALLRFLSRRHGKKNRKAVRSPRQTKGLLTGVRVSYERVLSGPGIGDLYDFMVDECGIAESASVTRRLARGDRNSNITDFGLRGDSQAASRALDLFAGVFGAEAGNLALKGLALRGVFVCGRIGAKIIPTRKRIFLDAMCDKGRLGKLLAKVPVAIALDDKVGLLGAGHLAARLASAH